MAQVRRVTAIRFPLVGRHGHGLFALIDEDDYLLVAGRSWAVGDNGYVVTGKSVRLHRLLLRPTDELVCDHINGDKLDNRRANLRVVTQAQNMQNVLTFKGPYRGVYFDARRGKWYGQVKLDGQRHSAPLRASREHARRDVEALRASLLPYSVPAHRRVA